MLIPFLHESEIPDISDIFRCLATNFTQPVHDKKHIYMNDLSISMTELVNIDT